MSIAGVMHVYTKDKALMVEANESVSPADINRYCFEKGIILNQLNLKRKSLEKRFLEITGKQSDR